MNVLIITTGGTLDKVHDTRTEGLVMSPTTLLQDLLSDARTDHPRIQEVLAIDSLDMTDDHRKRMLDAVKSAAQDHIVITHGTGTMDVTARYLADHVKDKTVVLTGAMRPFSLGKSDASFNLGGAVIAAQTLPSGVYGVMNGRVFSAEKLRKNVVSGRFDT